MWTERLRRIRDDDSGFAMIMSLVVAAVMMLFTMGMLATGLHLTDASVRDKRWNTALQVAEAGLDRAVYEISQDITYAGTGVGVLPMPGGEVELLVDHPYDGQIVIYATGWVPSRGATNALSRRIKVVFAPEDVFSFALFSSTGLYVKNTGAIKGDVFANEGVVVENGSDVDGDVISATEGVEIGNTAVITGDVYSGGPAGILVNNTAQVVGGAYAQATSCSGSAGSGEYGVTVNGTGIVGGDAVAWGTISGNVLGSRTPSNCQLAYATRPLPAYNWDPTLYSNEIVYSDLATFQAWVDSSLTSLTGVHYLWSDDCESDPSGVANVIQMGHGVVSDDFTLVTNCRIDMDNDFTVSAPDDAVVNIVVLNEGTDPAAVTIKNKFEVLPNDPAVLLYSSGLIEVKNSAESNGAVYAGAISIKNNLDITYDPRIERTLGFGDLRLDRAAWMECIVGTTGTDC